MGLNSDTKALTFREAYADETARAASLCTPGPVKPGEGPTRCFVAVKDYPVERLVGAAPRRSRGSGRFRFRCSSRCPKTGFRQLYPAFKRP